jgi:hypothetical protein
MKPSSPGGKTSRTPARNAVLLNLFGTPGLGTLLARRWGEGVGQLLLAVAGFVVLLVWFVRMMRDYYGLMFDQAESPRIHYGLLAIGAALFLAAWLWALVTSLQLLREAKTPPPELGPQPPPILPK